MDQGFWVPLLNPPDHCKKGSHLHAAHVACHSFRGLRGAIKVLDHHGHDAVRVSGVADITPWCIWGVAAVALSNSKQYLALARRPQLLQQLQRLRYQQQWQHRGRTVSSHTFSRPATAANQDAGKTLRLRAWPAFLAYVILRQIHQQSLRALAASREAFPHLAFIVGLHAIAFLVGTFFVGRNKAGNLRRNMGVLFAVFVADVLGWEALCRLGDGHLALSVSLLSGLMLPLSMAVSQLLLGQKSALGSWVGAVVVAAGVGYCNLGNPLARIVNMTEVVVLVAACLLPCLSLVGKEALMSGSQRLSVPTVGLLTCVAQLVAILRPHSWPPTLATPAWASVSALQQELEAFWHHGPLTYVVFSGLVRVALLVLIRASSASTLQLVHALAVPLGAATLTSGLPQNVQALLLASGGGALYLLGQKSQLIKAKAPAAPKNRQRKQEWEKAVEIPKLKKEETETKQVTEAEPSRQEKKLLTWEERQDRLQEQKNERRQQERLRRMQVRWAQQEEMQREMQQNPPSEPSMYADEEQ